MLKPLNRTNKFSVSNCPKTIPDADNDCDKKLNQSASVSANTCKYNACASMRISNSVFAINGFNNNFGTIEDELMFSNSIGSWLSGVWQKTKAEVKKDLLKFKEKRQKLKIKIQNLFHKKDKTKKENDELAEAQKQLKIAEDTIAELQLNLDVKDQQLADAPVLEEQNSATNPSWNTPQTGETNINTGETSKKSSFDGGDVVGILVGLAIAGTIIYFVRKQYKSGKVVHHLAHRPAR